MTQNSNLLYLKIITSTKNEQGRVDEIILVL